MRINFDWEQAEEDGAVLVNAPSRKVAIFPSSCACITLIIEDGQIQTITSIDADEAVELICLLKNAVAEVWPLHKKQIVEFAAHEAICKAMGA